MDKKQKVLDKLKKLAELLDEVHDNNPDNLFHEDWIEVTDTITRVKRDNEASSETLKRMNFIWRKNNTIKKYRANNDGKDMPYEEILDWEIKDIFMNHQMGKVGAIRFARENVVPSNGEKMSLIEAKKYVEDLVENANTE
jgi:hypothetical protein